MAIFKYKNADGTWETVESPGAVKYTTQSLADVEKQIARSNIGSYIKREVIFSGSSAEVTFPSDKAPADYDLLIFKLASSNGTPASCFIYDPNGSHAVPTCYMLDLSGNVYCNGISGLNSTTKGQKISLSAVYGHTAIGKIMGIAGYKFEKEA